MWWRKTGFCRWLVVDDVSILTRIYYLSSAAAWLWKMILFCLYFEICWLAKVRSPAQYLMVSIEIVSIEWGGGSAIRWCDNITKYVVCIISNISIQQVFLGAGLTGGVPTPHHMVSSASLCRRPVCWLQSGSLARTRRNVPVSVDQI